MRRLLLLSNHTATSLIRTTSRTLTSIRRYQMNMNMINNMSQGSNNKLLLFMRRIIHSQTISILPVPTVCCWKQLRPQLKHHQHQPPLYHHHHHHHHHHQLYQHQYRTMTVSTNGSKRQLKRQKDEGWFISDRSKRPYVSPNDPLRGGNIKYNNKISNILKLHICHNEYDTHVIQPDEDDKLFYTITKFTVNDIIERLKEVYYSYQKNISIDTIDIEYYEQNTWKPLIHINDLYHTYRGGTIPLQIRVSQFYDDTPLPPKYLNYILHSRNKQNNQNVNHHQLRYNHLKQYYKNNSINDSDTNSKNTTKLDTTLEILNSNYIITTIYAMVYMIQYDGYTRSSIKQYVLVHKRTNHEIRTIDYLLLYANKQIEFQSFLLNHINVLYHIIEYIHYDFVWNKCTI